MYLAVDAPTPPASRTMAGVNEAAEARYRRTTWLALVLALLATAPSLGLGLLLDDNGHKLFLQWHLAFGGPGFLDMFDVCGRAGGPAEIAARIFAGQLPWWTLSNLSIAFFRPLAVLTHYLDYWLWPSVPALMHAENIALYLALVFTVAVLYRRLFGATWTAGLALLFYAVDTAHAEGVAWIAGRNTLLTALFTILTVLVYDVGRRDGSRRARWLGPLCLLCAFASGEGAIATWAYLVPYAWLLDRGRVRERLLALAPLAGITVGWQLLYRSLGYGVHGSGFYRDPFDAPFIFLTRRLPEIGPKFLRAQLDLPAIALFRYDVLHQPLALILTGVVAFASLIALATVVSDRRMLGFWLFALLASLVPPSAAGVQTRLLFIPGVAAFALCAEVVVGLVSAAQHTRVRLSRYGQLALAGVLCFVHGPLALAFAPMTAEHLAQVDAVVRGSALMLPTGPDSRGARVFMLDTPVYFGTALAPLYRDRREPPIELHVLCASGNVVKVTRLDAESFALEPAGGFLLEPTSWLVRGPEHRFTVGQQIATQRFEATVEKITGDGRPSRVRFRIANLAAKENWFMRWQKPRYERLQLPAVGQSMWLRP